MKPLSISHSNTLSVLTVFVTLLIPIDRTEACSLNFTSPVRGATVFSAGVQVSGVGSGTANSGAVGQVVATINGQVFFQQSGTFTTLINFFGSGAASVNLSPGANYLHVSGSVEGCSASDGMVVYYEPEINTPKKNQGNPDVCVGNPINPLTGNKYQSEVLIAARPSLGLPEIGHRYNSESANRNWGLGYGWTGIILKKIVSNGQTLLVKDDSGRSESFHLINGEWQGDPDTHITLQSLSGGFEIIRTGGIKENYNSLGQLISQVNQGIVTYYEYGSEGSVSRIYGEGGSGVEFIYSENGYLSRVIEPDGFYYLYQYDQNNNLTSVSSFSSAGLEAISSRTYHYENPLFPHHLTGITDEEGQRFASWSYDEQGRAITSEHHAGVELSTVDYTYVDDVSDPRVTVTNALEKETTYHFTTLHGVRKVTEVEGHASANCVASNHLYAYDSNGNLDLVTDWKGVITDYDYDNTGLEIQRIEAIGTANERITTTTWDTSTRLPVTVTSPGYQLSYQYDEAGRVLQRHEGASP